MDFEKQNKILLVEDSVAVQETIKAILQKELGFEVITARTQNATRQILQASRHEIFLAILDLNLPDSPGGGIVDMVINAGIPPIILTSMSDDLLREYMMKKPIIDYVIKKRLHEIQYLVDAIRRLIGNRTRKALVVDDSSTTRMMIRELLERQFLTVIEASDGKEALKALGENQDISFVITDYNMPNMDGEDFILAAREKYSRNELAIISVSASEESYVSVKLLKSGANDFIHKPFSFEEFFCRVNQNIDAVTAYKYLRETAH